MMPIGRHRVEICRRLTLGGDHRSPPLIADGRYVEEIEQLKGHVGLQQRVGLALVEDPAAQVCEPLFLECGGGNRGVEFLFSHEAPPGARRPR